MSPRAYFGLGSNLGDRWGYLQAGVDGLQAAGSGFAVSRVYETAPVGGPHDQGPYLNCVVGLETDAAPLALLEIANALEDASGRVRLERFGPRTLDVDVLLIDLVRSDDPRLTLPHPRMFDRAFVLAPLEELDPSLVPSCWRDRLGGPAAVTAAAWPVGMMLHVVPDGYGDT